MKQNNLTAIKEEIDVLKRSKGLKIGRDATMCWISFNIDGEIYALHVQTAFRIRNKEEVLIANLDMFEPSESLKNSPSFDWETFDWDVQGFNRFDEWATQFNKGIAKLLSVKEVCINDFGDLIIIFDENIVFEVFNNSTEEECWRFFRKGSECMVIGVDGLID